MHPINVLATQKRLFLIKVPTACEPLILLLFTIPENEPGNQRFLRNLFRFMDRDAEGIEFAKLSGGVHGLCYAKRGMNVDEAPWT